MVTPEDDLNSGANAEDPAATESLVTQAGGGADDQKDDTMMR
jgi:hypothetical protein